MRRDRADVEVAITGAVRGVPVRLAQPGGARTQRAVDEQVPRQPAGTGLSQQRARLRRAGHRLPPVTDHFDAVRTGHRPQFPPVVEAADLGSGAFVHRDDSARRRGVQRGGLRLRALRRGQ